MSKSRSNAIKRDIILKCRLLEKIGYFIGTWGNVSVRVEEGFIITPSRIPYDVITIGDFVTMNLDGKILNGHRLPSSETEAHRAIYRKRKDVGAVIHSHSPYASAVSCLHWPIPPIVEDLAQVAGGRINCAPYVPGGQHMNVARAVAASIGKVNAVLLANHGVIACGRDLDEAFVTSQIVEKAALLLLLGSPLKKLRPIPDKFVREERHRYLYKYGTAKDFQ
ncbi:MAG: class II aldolase/adducin family protein [Verrucomicrobiota bacterium]|jgi:L-fuculose-phosphate aldolase